MADSSVISKFAKLIPSEDYKLLRREGIKHIEKLASKIWTDYNTHDPGITILELLCYAITELGYRSSYLIKDVLATAPDSESDDGRQFYSASEILPCNPVTINDFRKLIIDVEGVKNAWVKKTNEQEQFIYVDPLKNAITCSEGPAENLVELNGLYEVMIDFDEDLTEKEKENTKENVKKVLKQHRNLCEDFLSVDEVTHEQISICADIELKKDADIEEVLAQIYYKLSDHFSTSINFYTIEELLKKDKSAEEIFEGPLLTHGFIDNDEVETADLRTEIRVSDIINFIMDIDGVIAIRNILLSNRVDGKLISSNEKWLLQLSDLNHAAELDIDNSKIVFYKEVLPYIADNEIVSDKMNELKQFYKKYKLTGYTKDFEIPAGEFMDIEDYSPVQNDFPLCYCIGIEGIKESATKTRKAQAQQLKAYLMFFEQILANYFSQLANVRQLFSLNDSVDKTYFTQYLSDVPGIDDIYLNNEQLRDELQNLSEETELFEKRRNKFLNHLMGRFCEEINEYSMLLYSMLKSGTNKELIRDKLVFLNEYDVISSQRGKAFDYSVYSRTFDPGNISGIQRRIYRLLGFRSPEYFVVEEEKEKFIIRLYDKNTPLSILFSSAYYNTRKEAEADSKLLLRYGNDAENYLLNDDDGKYSYSILKDETNVIASTDKFEGIEIAEKIKEKIIYFFENHFEEQNLPAVEFSNASLNISEIYTTEDDALVTKYQIILTNPGDSSEILLQSKEYDDKECAESILHYILSHGDNQSNYKRTDKKTKIGFCLLDECGDIVASSPVYEDKNSRDKKLNYTIRFFRNQCDIEGFHVVEHILLRPKLSVEDQALLPVCLPAVQPQKSESAKTFTFEMFQDKPKKKNRRPQWRFRLRDDKKKIILKSEDYKNIRNCKHTISLIKEFFISGGDVRILQDKKKQYYFNMIGKNGEIICTSNYRKTRPEIIKIIEELKEYFVGKTISGENIGEYDKDPYSFRVSIIVPSWPERFRDINFRRFVEKTIRIETPAHIYPRICWIDLLQMKTFENIYIKWLDELSKNKPTQKTLSEMVTTLFNLKNVYPVVKLHDCKFTDKNEPQVILDYSALGII
jgi:uncharacterized protein